jgi:DNA polymerase III subunit epsilon
MRVDVKFIAIDVETANADMASICQIGAASFVDGALVDQWSTYVDPEDYFDDMNTFIHGIDESTVKGTPTFPDTASELNQILDGQIVVCHTHFDRVALQRVADKYGIASSNCTWLDSARVARRAWTKFATRGYGLANVCEEIGYDFRHHDALEDAKAAGHVLLAAMARCDLTLEDWLKKVGQPIGIESDPTIKRDGKPEGPLYGEVLVFTGTLDIPRRQAADMAASVGCQVAPNVTKNTSLLVVGDQDVQLLAGYDKSSKHRKAETLILKNQPIRILRESDFKKLIEQNFSR